MNTHSVFQLYGNEALKLLRNLKMDKKNLYSKNMNTNSVFTKK